ncbi:methyltransferase domain-containing protein [Pararhizobium sp. YC-54]|uniref:methyltransferase domain-containing protein n=1 Tax=Pararhizobium sp. YC-54 TaxID=2986920 RepID=UPI0021F75B06|nr:methyltransferase domain-containing protein [Pararhizobium sp. YC-54]MCV9999440.1 methyltransferase domain-containing protein [Pararhizobium sp. YC-54]
MRQAAADGETAILEMRQGDVVDPPFRGDKLGQFHVAQARFVLEHIPDPLQVVRNMADEVRPGGRVILSDDDYDSLRLWPEPPGFSSVWHAYQRTYDRHGNDPVVGRRLVQLLHQAGLVTSRNTLVFFGGCLGDPDFEDVVRNIASIVDEAIDDMVATGLSREAVTAAASRRSLQTGHVDRLSNRRSFLILWLQSNARAEHLPCRAAGRTTGDRCGVLIGFGIWQWLFAGNTVGIERIVERRQRRWRQDLLEWH